MSLIAKILALALILLSVKLANGQSVSTQMGAKAASLGSASVAIADEWSLFNNMAGIASLKASFASISYDLNTRLPNGNRMAMAAGTPLKFGALCGGVFKFGDDVYSEQLVTLGYANQLGLASLGLTVSYVQYRAEGFGTHGAITVSAGGIAKLSEKFSVGANIQNITQPKIGDNETLPVRMGVGVAFLPTDQLSLFGQVDKDIDFDATVRVGLEFELVKELYLRTGFNLNPEVASGGIGYQTKKLKIDYAIQYGFEVASSHQLSACWRFVKRVK